MTSSFNINVKQNLTFSKDTDATLSVAATDSGTAGKALTITAGSTPAADGNINGGNLILKSGLADGTGSSIIGFHTSTATSDNAVAERMRIHTNGNVGIGTEAPVLKTHILGALAVPATSGTPATGILRFSQPGAVTMDMGIATFGSTHGGWIQSHDSTNAATHFDLLLNPNGGNVGIGVTSPAKKLHVNCGGGYGEVVYENNQANFADAQTTLNSMATNTVPAPCCDPGSNFDMYIFWRAYNGSYVDNFYFKSSGTAIPFTGQHNSYSGNPNIKTNDNLDNYVGLIIKSLGIYRNDETDDITINNAWPVFQLTNSDNDKSVYGVITNRSDSSIANDNVDTGFYNGLGGKIRINSLGEGGIWVCNKNGTLENGYYITSTTVTGYGGKQILNEEFLTRYTVAKITCDCDFSLTKVVKRRIKLVDDPTGKVIAFDSQGNIEYENILDPDGNIQMVYPYDTRFLQADGTLLVDQTDYETRLANGEAVYIACFVGCTYHCG